MYKSETTNKLIMVGHVEYFKHKDSTVKHFQFSIDLNFIPKNCSFQMNSTLVGVFPDKGKNINFPVKLL